VSGQRIAIFGDLHGNRAAAEATLRAIDAEAPDATYCLGDLVGYGACPNETIDLVRARGIPTIMGNYDDGVGFDRDDCGCAYRDAGERERGQESLSWTRRVTSDDNKAYLRRSCRKSASRRWETVSPRPRSPRRMNEYLVEDRDPRLAGPYRADGRFATCSCSGTRTSHGRGRSRACASSTPAAPESRRTAIPRGVGTADDRRHGTVEVEIRRAVYDVATMAGGDPRGRGPSGPVIATDIETGGRRVTGT